MPRLVDRSAPPGSSGFPSEIEAALLAVHDGCAAVIEAVCGGGARAKDVSDAFGVHAKLGWQVWNVAYSHPFSAFRFLPNEHGMTVWLRSAAERGVPREVVFRLEEALDRVRTVAGVHAEDREMFEMLVDAQADTPSEETEERWRRQSFLGNSFTFGARAKCLLSTAVLFPAADPSRFSIVRLQGIVDLVRMRSGVRWPIASLVVQHDRTSVTPKREPLVDTGSDAPIMPKYCSTPLPPLERYTDGQTIRDELLPGTVGQTGASTIFSGEILHDLGPWRGSKAGETAHFGTGVRTPSELLVSDHIVHRSLFPGAVRELRVYSELISQTTRDERDRVAVSERLQHLGRGLLRVRTAELPQYGELLAEVFERIGLAPDDFDVFRVRMRYPPMPCSVMVRFELPPPDLATNPQ